MTNLDVDRRAVGVREDKQVLTRDPEGNKLDIS
jgi:hypothetical protein